jgi:hypothetical protein
MSSARRTLALPLMLLALLLQGFAPAAASVAAARMMDPFSNLPICSTSLNGAADEDSTPAQHEKSSCAACVVCSIPAVAPAPEVDAPAYSPVQVANLTPRVEIVGPRGPPRRTAQARAPPQST